MRTYISIFFLVFFSVVNSQKIVKKSILSPSISTVHIDGANCYTIEIIAKAIKDVIVEAIIDGEYKKDLVLNIKQEDTSINISAGFQPTFENPNDKLSAHKVVSIALTITVPLNKNVYVLGTSSSVISSGVYKELGVSLDDGHCSLANVTGRIKIQTQSGDIIVEKSSGNFIAESKYGEINKDIMPKGNSEFYLTTTTGNIRLKKM